MAVVVSAMGGKPKVTDLLLNSVSLAAAGNRAGSEVCACDYCCCTYPDLHRASSQSDTVHRKRSLLMLVDTSPKIDMSP